MANFEELAPLSKAQVLFRLFSSLPAPLDLDASMSIILLLPLACLVVPASLVRREMRIFPDKRNLSVGSWPPAASRHHPESRLHLVTWKGRAAHIRRARTAVC